MEPPFSLLADMGFFDDITLGRWVPGNSPLHHLDPRLKLIGLPLVVIAVFAGTGFSPLAPLAVLAFVLIAISGISWQIWWRGLWILRWLLLFSLLLHLFFSPGRTLFGLTWLSQDGLLRGTLVCCQLTLAVVFSSMLTLTTSPESLVAAFSALAAPLKRVGFPVREGAMLLLLILHFIPILREEALAVVAEGRRQGLDLSNGSLVARGRNLRNILAPLVLRLADRADLLALRMAAGDEPPGADARLKPLGSMGKGEVAVIGAWGLCLAIMVGVW